MVLRLPHIHGNLSNLFGFDLLGAFALAMLAFSVFFAFRLVFEIQGATVSSSKCVVIYRYLGKRTLELPYRGRIKRKVRLPDLKSQGGPRWGILIYRSMTQRVVIPLEMQGAEDLAVALTRS